MSNSPDMLSRMRRLLWVVLLCTSFVAAQTAAPQSQTAAQAAASAHPQTAGRTAAPSQPQFFHITPERPVEELRSEALKAQPPLEHGDFLKPDLVELVKLDPTIKLDIRYATSRNFLSTPVYEEARAFMQRPAAEAVARASEKLRAKGFGLMIYDAYRPWYVTKIFWDATPPKDHNFVADPSQGSHHNRGCAVDLTLYDLKTGEPVPMTGLYDEMSERSYPNYTGGTEEERRNRETLRAAMEAEGFSVYEFEWWHFDYKDWKRYPIMNLRFDEIDSASKSSTDREKTIPPKPYFTPDPEFDMGDLQGRQYAVILAVVTIDGFGNVVESKIAKGFNRKLDTVALETVKKWKFVPAEKNGQPITSKASVEILFRKR